ncbi:MAG: hypothetical protein ACRYFA_01530 [Janthinobacterium lividum]
MKKIKVLLFSAAVLFATQSFAQDPGKGKVGRAINKVGNKTAELAVKGTSAVADKPFDGKVAPNGETVYINKNSKYYYVNKKGKKVYVSKMKLKDAPAK